MTPSIIDSRFGWWQSDRLRVVSLMEILRVYMEFYVAASYSFGLFAGTQRRTLTTQQAEVLKDKCQKLAEECSKCDLPVSLDSVRTIIAFLERPVYWERWEDVGMPQRLEDLQERLESELGSRLFIHLRSDRRRYFDSPLEGWKEVIERFPDGINDIEEMSKCFALSRYAASVFHSTRVVEIGLVELGKFLGVADPKSGWTAVANELKRIVSKKRENLTAFEIQHFPFIEQVQGTVASLKDAWRNKISHAQSTPVLLTTDFTPDICEEIIIASRAFMRRLATEMPERDTAT